MSFFSKKIILTVFFGLCITFRFAPLAQAEITHLEGAEAREYIGDLKQRLITGSYHYEILQRSHRDSMNARNSDGVIFSRITNKFYYKERTNGKCIFIIDDPRGREEDPVTADAIVWNPIQNTLGDDHPKPHVYLKDGNDVALVYVGKKTALKHKVNKDGYLEITLTVRGQHKGRHRR